MINLKFEAFNNDLEALVSFLTSDTWQFHSTPNPDPEKIRKNFDTQLYDSDESKTFWAVDDTGVKVGLIRVYDLEDPTPVFDIRIHSAYRGMGLGTVMVNWLVDHIFTNYPQMIRIEAHTRHDNYAMRCVLHKCGFIKEAHHRNEWPDATGKRHDSVGYGKTKEDWETGTIRPILWDDFKC